MEAKRERDFWTIGGWKLDQLIRWDGYSFRPRKFKYIFNTRKEAAAMAKKIKLLLKGG